MQTASVRGWFGLQRRRVPVLAVACLGLGACGGGSEESGGPAAQRAARAGDTAPLTVTLAPPRQVGASRRIQLDWHVDGPASTVLPQRRRTAASPFEDLPPRAVFDRGSALQYDFPTAAVRARACDAAGRCVDSEEQPLLDVLLATTAEVRPDATAPNTVFGNRIALSRDGNTLAVAAPTERVVDDPRFPGIGAVFVFSRRPDGRWRQDARLDKLHLPGNFGDPFALSGDGRTLVVGNYTAPGTRGGIDPPETEGGSDWRGAVAVYARGADDRWQQQAWIQADTTRPGEMFGFRVVICHDGNVMLVAAAGRLLLFRRDGSRWSQERTFESDDPDRVLDGFAGLALSADGTTFAVSAAQAVPGERRIHVPAVDVWRRCGSCAGGWSRRADLRSTKPPRYPSDDDRFGASLALSADGQRLAVGAPADADSGAARDDLAFESGAVHLFAAGADGRWQQRRFLKPRQVVAGDAVGTQVVVDDAGRLVLASGCGRAAQAAGLRRNHREQPPSTDTGFCSFGGAAYAFTRDDAEGWTHSGATLAQADGQVGFVFFSLALSGDGGTYALGQQVYGGNDEGGRVVVY